MRVGSDLEDGRLRVVLRTPDTGWVRRLALRLGEDGRVISPPALVAEIREAAAAALANYVVCDTAAGTRSLPAETASRRSDACRLGPRREDVSGAKEDGHDW